MTTGAEDTQLLSAVQQLRTVAQDATFTLDTPGVEAARTSRSALLRELDDYVIPRLNLPEAPLLAVVGGSTGVGKSTLVNSLVGSVVSRSGALRPTTRSPVLVHHQQDTGWFAGSAVLPGLARVTTSGNGAGEHGDQGVHADHGGGDQGLDDDHGALRLVGSEMLAPGLALLDAPDIDSVVQANRVLASQLLAAADLWLFVTTAARYADAVPWDLLRSASRDGTSVAIVLNRVPPEAMVEVRTHFASMLRDHGLAGAPIFTALELDLTDDGLLPEDEIARLRSWLSALARDARARSIVVRRTLAGALSSSRERGLSLSEASIVQRAAAVALHQEVAAAFTGALHTVEQAMTSGTLVRGEVLARWQQLVGSKEFLRAMESGRSRLRDRITAAVKGSPPQTSELGEALQSGVAELLTVQARVASTTVVSRWRQLPGGAELLATHAYTDIPAPDAAKVARLVRDWHGEVLELVRAVGGDRRSKARVVSFGVNGVGVIAMLLVFSCTGGVTGGEVAAAGGSAVLAQRVLEAMIGDQVVRDLAATARRQLMVRVEDLYAGEQLRLHAAVASIEVNPGQADMLRAASTALESAL